MKWLQIDPKSIVRGEEVYSTWAELLNPPLGGPRLLLPRRQLTTTSGIDNTITTTTATTTTTTTTTAEGSSKSAPQYELPVSFRRGLLTEVSSFRAPSAFFTEPH